MLSRVHMRVTFLLLMTSAAVTAFAGGSLEYRFASSVPAVSSTYDSTIENDLPQTLSITHISFTTGSTSYFVTFSAGQSGSFASRQARSAAGGTLTYQIMDNVASRNTLEDLSVNPPIQNVLSGTNPASGVQQLTSNFVVALPAGQLPNAGTYVDSVNVGLYSGSPTGTNTAQTTQTMSLSFTVPKIAELSLVPVGSPFAPGSTSSLMDFGMLTQGTSRGVDLLVRANSSYQVALQSQQGGVLAITTAGDTSTIPYTLQFNGSPLSLAAGVPNMAISAGPPTTGARYPITVVIGNVGNATEGTYQDNITITVTAN